jgi:HEAT repeat protein
MRYSLSVGLAVLALNFAGPFQSPYVTSPEAIGAPNVWLGIMTVISQLTWVAIAPLWGFIMDRYGRKPVVMLGFLVGLTMLCYIFLTPGNRSIILPLLSLAAGFFGPAFWEGSGQLMLTLAQPEKRVVYISWYNTLIGLVSAAGPIAGGIVFDLLTDFRLELSFIRLSGFHVVQLCGLVLLASAALLLRGVREGRERPIAILVNQFATAGVFRSYSSLGALSRDSGDPRVARALRRLEGDEGVLVIREVIERLDDPSFEIRSEAARALGRIGSSEAVEELMKRLADPASSIRIEAARALGSIGDERAVPDLARCLAVGSPELRAACAEALGRIGGEAARAALSTALSGESDQSVAASLAEAVTSSAAAEEADSPIEVLDAIRELLPRLVEARNAALKRQYAIAIGNILGNHGEFYAFITGENSVRQARCRSLFAAFRLKVEPLLASRAAEAAAVLDECGRSVETESGTAALTALLRVHRMLMERLFGSSAEQADLFEIAGRADMRLGAWCWLASEAERRVSDVEGRMDEQTCYIIALLGLYYLGS